MVQRSPMFFASKQFMWRSLFVLCSLLLALFASDVLALEGLILLKALYLLLLLVMALAALLYSAPKVFKKIRDGKIRNDIDIPLPDSSVLSRDYQKDLMEKERLFQFMFNSSIDGFWTYDIPTGKVTWSDRAAFVLGLPQKVMGDSFNILKTRVFEKDWVDFKTKLAEALKNSDAFSTTLRLLNGKTELIVNARTQYTDEGRPICVFGSLSKPTERSVYFEKESVSSAFKDSLTGVHNRKGFLKILEQEMAKNKQREDYLFALVVLDIDHFSAINDNYSIDLGDTLLRQVAERISLACRSNDSVARIGADVFGVVLRNIQDNRDSELQTIVKRLYSRVKTSLYIDSQEVFISVSMAVVINREFDKVDDLLANANAVLREIKRSNNRGGVHFFTSGIREKAMQLYRLEFELRKAIQAREFILYYQPIIDASQNNRVVAFEALVRWNNTKRGIISPAEFIPMAEETGLIIPLGEMILKMACLQAKEWVDNGYKDIKVAVNFSAKQFSVDNMVEQVKQVLYDTKLNPRNLKIEITEYSTLRDMNKSIEIMKSLSNLGLQISIDDFGTGYSSLVYLKNYPVHTLKMDSSFVQYIAEDEEDAAFASMVIGIAKSLNLEIIAEGVETKEQLDFLLNNGCSLIQGFYFSRPLPKDQAFEYLKNHTPKEIQC